MSKRVAILPWYLWKFKILPFIQPLRSPPYPSFSPGAHPGPWCAEGNRHLYQICFFIVCVSDTISTVWGTVSPTAYLFPYRSFSPNFRVMNSFHLNIYIVLASPKPLLMDSILRFYIYIQLWNNLTWFSLKESLKKKKRMEIVNPVILDQCGKVIQTVSPKHFAVVGEKPSIHTVISDDNIIRWLVLRQSRELQI